MRQILGIVFMLATTVLTLIVAYCIGMGIVGHYGWFGVALGVLLSDIAAFFVTKELLYKY